jgi:hypothetical protein
MAEVRQQVVQPLEGGVQARLDIFVVGLGSPVQAMHAERRL